jgi:asparagine synthase (glutamine-hydrolysing)
LGLPAIWKVHGDRPAKFLLRQAFSAHLPEEIVNRPKQKFSHGAGSSDALMQLAEREISDAEFQSVRAYLFEKLGYQLTNKESLLYYRIFHEYYRDQWVWPSMGHSRSL